MNAIVAIVRANLTRLLTDRSSIFFLVVLPLLIVFALGAAIGNAGSNLFVGVVDPAPSAQSAAVRAAVERSSGVRVYTVASPGELRDLVARGRYDAGWTVTTSGGRTTINWVQGTNLSGAELRTAVENAAREAATAARVEATVASDAAVPPERARAAVAAVSVPLTTVRVTQIGVGGENDPAAIRAVLAGGQLTLFMFLTSLFGASAFLLSRQYGVTRRTQAAPVTTGAIILGESISRYLVAMIQAFVIIVGSRLLFGVQWRSPVAVLALCAAMALVGSGVAMLVGTLGKSEQQVGAIAMLAGLVLAALGGSMQPLEFFPDAMRTVAFAITPHAWMNDSLWTILVDGGGLAEVWTHVAVLVVVGLALLGLAARTLARTLR